MVKIRTYCAADAVATGILIADTYARFNLTNVPDKELAAFLGPFAHAWSQDAGHRAEIARMIQSATVLIAENAKGDIVGVLRGRPERLGSLFVHSEHQRQGIGAQLVAAFEQKSSLEGVAVIRVHAALEAVPFYMNQGFVRSTGVRNTWSFDGYPLPVQPMKKRLSQPPA